jgi:hypothetical protein
MCRRERRAESGAALAAVLLSLTLLLPLGALAVLQARTGLLTQQNLRGDVEALHAAEAGLACALAKLEPFDLDAIARGSDGISATADDGILPFSTDCLSFAAPLGVEVRSESGGGAGLLLVATGRGSRAASRVIVQHVHRDAGGDLERSGWRER